MRDGRVTLAMEPTTVKKRTMINSTTDINTLKFIMEELVQLERSTRPNVIIYLFYRIAHGAMDIFAGPSLRFSVNFRLAYVNIIARSISNIFKITFD